MRIKTNIPALNAQGRLSRNQSRLAKNLEKLSSGYRINRAGDDAAGLAISEKMRALITGMEQAELNAEDGIGLIRTGEGALQEVHAMLNRLDELAVQSANGTYNDEENRSSMQEEVDQICDEIERIARLTNFNGINLFQDEGLDAEGDPGASLLEAEKTTSKKAGSPTLEDVLADKSNTLKNIIYTETTFDFETTQSPSGASNNFTDPTYRNIADTLQASIVPQVVSAIMDKYTAFNYLTGSSIGIGLRLYSDPGSSVLASVSVGTSYTQSGGTNSTDNLTYSLAVNVAKVGDMTNAANRSSLEQTIAHEMIHAFMDEATTVGMTGIAPSGATNAKFPSWFVEGMAQTASGPGNWTRGVSLNLNENSTHAQITAALSGNNALGKGTSASEYGTGYLACMYLGYLAGGKTADMDNPTGAAAAITQGISNILSNLIAGNSLTSVIADATNGKYATINSFQNGFATDSEALNFVQKLLKYTSASPDGTNVGGGLISGSLSATDPVSDNTISGLKLFALNTSSTEVKNVYPAEVTVLSGGGNTVSGVKPVVPATPVVYPTNVFTVTGGVENTDWRFDKDTGILHILTDTALTISGGTLKDATGSYYGNIEIGDNVNANITLNGVEIDASKRTGNIAGISIGNGSNANITMSGVNTVKGGGQAAGIQLTGNFINGKDKATQEAEHNAIQDSSVTIAMQSGSVLNVGGGTVGTKGGAGIGAAWATDTSKSDIKITGSGTINSNGGIGGAGIGGSEGGSIGNIEIQGNGIAITAVGGDHGAGIGGGGWVSTYSTPDVQKVESIKITGDTDINASSKSHGTGIGSGCHGTVGTIEIGDGTAADNSLQIISKGGNDGASIGAGWAGNMGSITINGGNITATAGTQGAGIGSGYQAEGGSITIKGGNITATGSTNSSGIGSGKDGTVSGIEISGGTITADGGWTNDGGNIGGYTDKSGKTKAAVTISDPSGLTIKAGEKGEGKYITTGTKDSSGNTLYALDMKYIDQLLQKGGVVTLTAPGTDPASLSYPLQEVKVKLADGTEYSWTSLKHMSENSAYIWARGEDITVTFKDGDGTEGSIDLRFFEDYGLWRADEKDLPPELPKEPGYVDTGSSIRPSVPLASGAIILQVGPTPKDTFGIPRFYFSRAALKLDEFDVSTQDNARDSIDRAGKMIDRVSDIRGTYGAMDNALEHIINNLNTNIENLSASESRIRDVDMAKEMMEYTKNSILVQSAQAMLAQANTLPQAILQLLR